MSALPGYSPRPPLIKLGRAAHQPDGMHVTQRFGRIYEVKSREDITSAHTASQLRVFATAAMERGWTLRLIVPRGSGALADRVVRALRIEQVTEIFISERV